MFHNPKYKRILLKISGEALQGKSNFGHDLDAIEYLTQEIASIDQEGVQICLVVGGGNLCRGKQLAKHGIINRATADYMGMLGTAMNGLALQDALRHVGVKAKMFSSIHMDTVCDPYSRDRAMEALEDGSTLIFSAGTGNPFVTTDTISVLRAVELECDVMLKGTQVDGVYNADPKKTKGARMFKKIKYNDVISRQLGVMDLPAVHIAKEHSLPIVVFNIHRKGKLAKIVEGGFEEEGNFSVIQ